MIHPWPSHMSIIELAKFKSLLRKWKVFHKGAAAPSKDDPVRRFKRHNFQGKKSFHPLPLIICHFGAPLQCQKG